MGVGRMMPLALILAAAQGGAGRDPGRVSRVLDLAAAALPRDPAPGLSICARGDGGDPWWGDASVRAVARFMSGHGLAVTDCPGSGQLEPTLQARLWLDPWPARNLEAMALDLLQLESVRMIAGDGKVVDAGYPMAIHHDCGRRRLAILVLEGNGTSSVYEVAKKAGRLARRCQGGPGDLEACREALDDSDVSGETMTVVHDTWGMMWEPNRRGVTGSFEGVMHDVLMIAAKRLNLTLDIKANSDPRGGWGLPDKNGNWSGMAGSLQRSEADIIGPGMEPTLQRSEIIDFSVSVISFRATLFVRRPTAAKVSWQNYYYEFDSYSWILIGLTAVSLIAGFFFILRREIGFGDPPALTKASSIVLRSLVNKGTEVLSHAMSTRVLLLVTLLFATVLFSSYRASMNSFLAVIIPVIHVKSLADVPEHKPGLAFWAGTTYEIDFQEAAKDSVMGRIYQSFLSDPQAQITSYLDGLRSVIDHDYALLAETITIDNMVDDLEDLHCKVARVPDYTYRKVENAFGFPRGSRFLGPLNREIIRMKGEGVVHRLIDKYFWRRAPTLVEETRCTAGAGSPLGFSNVVTPFLVLVAGAAASAASVLAEKLLPMSSFSGVAPKDRRMASVETTRLLLLRASEEMERAGMTDQEKQMLIWDTFQKRRLFLKLP